MPESPPRIGYILKKFPRLSETFVLNEILELERQGADVHVLSLYAPDEGRFHASVAQLRNPIRYLPEMRPRDLFRRFQSDRETLGGLLGRATPALEYVFGLGDTNGLPVMKRALTVAFEVQRLGITHVHSHFATVAARTAVAVKLLTGTPFSVTAHAKDIYRDTVEPDAFARIVDESEFLATVCDANRRYILDRLAPGRDAKVVRLYNGVDTSLFSPQPGDGDRSDDAPLRVLSVGRLVPKKGMNLLLAACARLRDQGVAIDCTIVGDGEDRVALERQHQELGLESTVRFLGALPQGEIVPLYRQADVVALACVTDPEGNRDALPTTLLEGMAAGKPLVSMPVGGVAEIVIPERNGLLVDEGSVDGLVETLARLAGDAELRERLGRDGRDIAGRRFDLASNVSTLLGMFGDGVTSAAQAVRAEATG